jgi:hypothetical protein
LIRVEREKGAGELYSHTTKEQIIRIEHRKDGKITIEALRFAPVDKSHPFYDRAGDHRDAMFDAWQYWNYEMYFWVVLRGMSISEAQRHLRKIDKEVLVLMSFLVAISSLRLMPTGIRF